MEKVSIIVPIYNVENYVGKCIDSLKNQTYKNIIVYCVNDGTKDNSRKIVEKHIKGDNRFIILDKENGGLSDARNYALKKVKTKYVMFVDGDDFVNEDFVEIAVGKMKEDDLDMLIFGYTRYYLFDGSKDDYILPIKDGVYNLNDDKELLALTPNAAWNKIYKTSLFKDNNIVYPFGYTLEDLGTTPKLLLKAKRVGYMHNCLYNYMVDRPNNISTNIDKKLYHVIDMCKSIMDYYIDLGEFDRYKEEFYYLVNRNLISSLRKAMNLKDKEFANMFINDVHNFRDSYLKNVKDKYHVKEEKNDFIYMNKLLTKLYYIYKGR